MTYPHSQLQRDHLLTENQVHVCQPSESPPAVTLPAEGCVGLVPLTPVLRLCLALPKVPDCSGNSEWVDMIVTETLREGMKMWLDLQQKLELEQAEMGGGCSGGKTHCQCCQQGHGGCQSQFPPPRHARTVSEKSPVEDERGGRNGLVQCHGGPCPLSSSLRCQVRNVIDSHLRQHHNVLCMLYL